MNKHEQLDLFLDRTRELVDSTYILADVKIAGVLKAIASSETMVAIFQNCLSGFDYYAAKKKYLVPSKFVKDKGEFILPQNSRELLAFIFTLLVDIDGNRISLGEFINTYFFEDGSFSSGYSAFINAMIKPFRNSVKLLMEKVIEGSVQDPVEAIVEQEEKLAREKEEAERNKIKEQELSKKVGGESIIATKDLLFADKQKIKKAKLEDSEKKQMTLIIDMLANAIESDDKDAIEYAFVAYKYLTIASKKLFRKRLKVVTKLIGNIINAI